MRKSHQYCRDNCIVGRKWLSPVGETEAQEACPKLISATGFAMSYPQLNGRYLLMATRDQSKLYQGIGMVANICIWQQGSAAFAMGNCKNAYTDNILAKINTTNPCPFDTSAMWEESQPNVTVIKEGSAFDPNIMHTGKSNAETEA